MSGWTSWWWNCFSGYAEMRAALLGIDSGTQSTKAILVEADTGLVLSLGRAPHALTAVTPGQKEQEPSSEAITRLLDTKSVQRKMSKAA